MTRHDAEHALAEAAEILGLDWRTLPLSDREAAVDVLVRELATRDADDEEGA
jgi:hypothetical protein